MPQIKNRLTRLQAIELLIDAKVVAEEHADMVSGSDTEIEFWFGGIDADKDGFFRRADVSRLISYWHSAKNDAPDFQTLISRDRLNRP